MWILLFKNVLIQVILNLFQKNRRNTSKLILWVQHRPDTKDRQRDHKKISLIQQNGGCQRGRKVGEMENKFGKEGRIYGNRKKLTFGWYTDIKLYCTPEIDVAIPSFLILVGNDFLGMTTKSQATKTKIHRWAGLHQIKNPLQSKRRWNEMEPPESEKIFVNYITDRG